MRSPDPVAAMGLGPNYKGKERRGGPIVLRGTEEREGRRQGTEREGREFPPSKVKVSRRE